MASFEVWRLSHLVAEPGGEIPVGDLLTVYRDWVKEQKITNPKIKRVSSGSVAHRMGEIYGPDVHHNNNCWFTGVRYA
jgi:hypothetical protein